MEISDDPNLQNDGALFQNFVGRKDRMRKFRTLLNEYQNVKLTEHTQFADNKPTGWMVINFEHFCHTVDQTQYIS